MHKPIQSCSCSSRYRARSSSLSTPFISFQQIPEKAISSPLPDPLYAEQQQQQRQEAVHGKDVEWEAAEREGPVGDDDDDAPSDAS